MISLAKANFQRISPRKARVVVDMIRGRNAAEALQLLDFTPKAAAGIVKKVLASAVANAKNGGEKNVEGLFVSRAFVDMAPNGHLRRWRPRAMGRATPIVKGTSHIVIELDRR